MRCSLAQAWQVMASYSLSVTSSSSSSQCWTFQFVLGQVNTTLAILGVVCGIERTGLIYRKRCSFFEVSGVRVADLTFKLTSGECDVALSADREQAFPASSARAGRSRQSPVEVGRSTR
jgi:hypothetical protein